MLKVGVVSMACTSSNFLLISVFTANYLPIVKLTTKVRPAAKMAARVYEE